MTALRTGRCRVAAKRGESAPGAEDQQAIIVGIAVIITADGVRQVWPRTFPIFYWELNHAVRRFKYEQSPQWFIVAALLCLVTFVN